MPQKFLVIQTAFLGDVVLVTSVLGKLHRFYPEAQIDVVVRKGNEALFDNHPFLHQVIVWNKKKRKHSNLAAVIRKVRAGKYDVVINAHRFSSSGIITLFSGAPQRIGFAKNPMAFCFTRRLPHRIGRKGQTNYLHEVERNLSLIAHLTDGSGERPRLYPSADDYRLIEPYTSTPFITVSPASVWFTKQVPEEVWARFISSVSGYGVYLLGSEIEQELCSRIIALSGSSFAQSLCGRLSLLQSAALMSKAKMNYVNDSAPMHLASAMNAPVAALYCSTIPQFGFGPLSDQSVIIETHETLKCRPCGLHGHKQCPQGHFRCSRFEPNDLLAPLITG